MPLVTNAQMERVRDLWAALGAADDHRLDLALRRFNSAAIRHDPEDTILDATIALEILLGDRDTQAIGWKLRMRAAALEGIEGSPDAVEKMHEAMTRLYELRSTIVHGGSGKRRKKLVAEPEEGRQLALWIVRKVFRRMIACPQYLDPLRIDKELLLAGPATLP